MRPLPETVIVRGGGQRRQKLMQHMLVVGDGSYTCSTAVQRSLHNVLLICQLIDCVTDRASVVSVVLGGDDSTQFVTTSSIVRRLTCCVERYYQTTRSFCDDALGPTGR